MLPFTWFAILMLVWNIAAGFFICDFKHNNTCGYESQENLLPFKLVEEFETLSSAGMMMLDLANANVSIALGARLIGKYYPSYYASDACLVIKFLAFGSGINRWSVIQRDTIDRRLYEFSNDWYAKQSSSKLDQYWTSLTLPVDLTGGPVMFFIEVVVNGHHSNTGLFALDHIVFMYQKCPFKQMPHYPCLDDSCV